MPRTIYIDLEKVKKLSHSNILEMSDVKIIVYEMHPVVVVKIVFFFCFIVKNNFFFLKKYSSYRNYFSKQFEFRNTIRIFKWNNIKNINCIAVIDCLNVCYSKKKMP